MDNTTILQLVKKYAVLICLLCSVSFILVATAVYPGGSILDKDSAGFDWSKNFFSNLFLVKALNGTANPSRIWALISMVFNSMGYGIFFMHTSRKMPHRHSELVLKTIGIVNMLFTFLIATPWHDLMVTVSSTLTMLGLFYITVPILKTKLHALKFFCIGCLMIFYTTLYLYGAGDWALLAVMQKVSALCFMLLILTIEYFLKGEDLQITIPPVQE